MEKEIEKLKQEYLKTPIPKSLEQKGFGDVLQRISLLNEKPHQFYYSQLVRIIVLVAILFTGFVGFAQASQPGTPLYPVKKLTAEVISRVTGKTPENIEKEINTYLNIESPSTPTPTKQVTPTVIPSPENENEQETEDTDENKTEKKIEIKTDDSKIEVEIEIPSKRKQRNDEDIIQEEVRGASTIRVNNNQENKQQEEK